MPGGSGGLPALRSRLCRGGSVLPAWSRPVRPLFRFWGETRHTARGSWSGECWGLFQYSKFGSERKGGKKSPMNRTELHKQSLLRVFYAKCRGVLPLDRS